MYKQTLESCTYTLDQSVLPELYDTTRPTVAIGLCMRDALTLVRPTKDTTDSAWILVQGGIEFGESIRDALHREILEETGISLPDVASGDLRMEIVGQFENQMPPDRADPRPKHTICVLVRPPDPCRIVLNGENTQHVEVGNRHHLWDLLGRGMYLHRPKKALAICEMAVAAQQRGFLTWSCGDLAGDLQRSMHQAIG